MNILDIVLIVLIVLTGLIGFSKGFLNSLLSLVGSLLSFVGAFFLAKPLAELLNSWFSLGSTIGKSLSSQITPFFSSFTNATGSEILANHCSAGGILKYAFKLFINPETVYESETALASSLGLTAGNLVLMAICIILAFIVIKIVIKLLSKIFDSMKKNNKAINGLDKLLGLIMGAAKGLLIIAIVIIIANCIQTIPAVASALDTVFEGSTVAKPLYDFVSNLANSYLKNIDFNAMLSGMV